MCVCVCHNHYLCVCVCVSAIEKVAKTVDKMPELPFSEKQVFPYFFGSYYCGFEKKKVRNASCFAFL